MLMVLPYQTTSMKIMVIPYKDCIQGKASGFFHLQSIMYPILFLCHYVNHIVYYINLEKALLIIEYSDNLGCVCHLISHDSLLWIIENSKNVSP